jgi:hypothetical protein
MSTHMIHVSLWAEIHQPRKIDGEGNIEMYPSSNRTYVLGPWLNTQVTIYEYVPSDTTGVISIRSRSNHRGGFVDSKSMFGDYIAVFIRRDEIELQKEVIHPIYIKGVSVYDYKFPHNKWIGLRMTCETVEDTKVKLQVYIKPDDSWCKVCQYIDEPYEWPGVPAAGTDPFEK